jgi:ascorbate-specific PTS system EIIC-type component UlaA
MTALLLPLLLLAVALVCAVAYALAKIIGVVIVVVAAIVGVVLLASQSSESTMFVGYVVAFGLPFFAGAGALGVFAGKQLREGRFALSTLPFLAIGGLIGYVAWSQYAEAREVQEVESFLRGLPQLERLTGGPVRILPATNTTFSAGEPGRRE